MSEKTVAELLYASIAAHLLAKQETYGKGDHRRMTRARDFGKLREAYELRKQADAADPAHADPAWSEEQAQTANGKDTHAALMAFYREKLGPEAVPVSGVGLVKVE